MGVFARKKQTPEGSAARQRAGRYLITLLSGPNRTQSTPPPIPVGGLIMSVVFEAASIQLMATADPRFASISFTRLLEVSCSKLPSKNLRPAPFSTLSRK